MRVIAIGCSPKKRPAPVVTGAGRVSARHADKGSLIT
jgi:hypothetical protein